MNRYDSSCWRKPVGWPGRIYRKRRNGSSTVTILRRTRTRRKVSRRARCSLPENSFVADRTRVFLVFETQQESDGTRTHETYELETTIELAEQFRDQILNIIKLKNPDGRTSFEQQQQQQQQQQRDGTKKRRSILNLIGGSIGSNNASSKP